MTKEIYGCACCNGVFGQIMASNHKVQDLRAQSSGGWACNWGIDWTAVGHRVQRRDNPDSGR